MARLRCTEPFAPRGSPAPPAFTMPFMRKRHRTRWLQNRRALAHRLMEVQKLLAPLLIGSQNQFLNFPKGSLSGLTPVGADPILTHPADPILTRGWTLAA